MKWKRLVVAFLLAAGCAVEKTPQEEAPPIAASPPDTVRGPLRRGIHLPSVEVLSVDGERRNVRTLVGGKDTIVFFLSTSCDVCTEMLANWTAEEIPEHLNLFAVVDETVEYGRAFSDREKLPFPVYMDTNHIFLSRWSVNEFPTVAGLRGDGLIVYARRGVAPELFTPARAETLLARGKDFYGKADR